MSIIHCDQADLAIYVPPKCGTKLVEQLVDFPELEGLFRIGDKDDFAPRKNRVVVLRNHLERLLSVYYDKIVDPNFNDTSSPGWRKRGNKNPSGLGFHPNGYKNFQTFLLNIAVNTECRLYNQFVPHMLPYTTDTAGTSYLLPHPDFERLYGKQLWTHDLATDFIPTVFTILADEEVLQPDKSLRLQLQDRWENLSTPHKIKYGNSMPDPSKYGSECWSKVHWEDLFELFQETGSLPSRRFMYSEVCQAIARSQIGYRLDNHTFNRYVDPELRHDLLSLRF